MKIILKILAILDNSYKKVSLKANGYLFCILFNFRAKLLCIDIIFTWNRNERIYSARNKKYQRFFYSKGQNWNSYRNGIEQRAYLMGREYFLNEIDFKKNDLIVDCGANIGDLQLYFQEKKLDFFLRYIGIEPSYAEFSCLQRNISQSSFMSKNNFNMGLWSENIKKEFFVSSEYADSSFIKPKLFSDTAIIDCQRLDEFLNEPIKLLKIEAEGGEPEVLI